MQESVEAVGEFVVACREATKLFEPVEESLNQVACFVPLPIELARPESVATRRDDGLSARLGDCCDEHIAVISLVSDDCIGLDGIDQCRPLRNVGCLATGEDQAQWIAQGIHACMNLGSQPTARAADRLIATVFFNAPAECWCARTTVESMNSSSRSASPWSASATRDQTPLASQRAKRTYTECQFPNLGGRSRQGFPTRAVYSTASMNNRLSAARPPLSVGLPGNSPEIRAHCASLNMSRSIAHTQIPHVNTNQLL